MVLYCGNILLSNTSRANFGVIIKTVETRKKCLKLLAEPNTSSPRKERTQNTVVYVIDFHFCLGTIRNWGFVTEQLY